jgi:hypothetical protein
MEYKPRSDRRNERKNTPTERSNNKNIHRRTLAQTKNERHDSTSVRSKKKQGISTPYKEQTLIPNTMTQPRSEARGISTNPTHQPKKRKERPFIVRANTMHQKQGKYPPNIPPGKSKRIHQNHHNRDQKQEISKRQSPKSKTQNQKNH